MIFLTKKQIIKMHERLAERTGGFTGIKNEGLLDSAVHNPLQTFMGEELYLTIQQKAASLCYGLIRNHAFHDGNKRIGVLAMLTFLAINGMEIKCSDEALIELGLNGASGVYRQEDILDWIKKYCE